MSIRHRGDAYAMNMINMINNYLSIVAGIKCNLLVGII